MAPAQSLLVAGNEEGGSKSANDVSKIKIESFEEEDVDPFPEYVDVLECAGEEESIVMGVEEDPDATENSSSFGNTFSGSEDEGSLSSSDLEVDSLASLLNTEKPDSDGDAAGGRFSKKKKVTASWRRFISPLSWRCQWLELRMNELQSQASIYDKELVGYKREKQLQSKIIEIDGSVSRSVPLICQNHNKRAMRRKRRKRNENIVDVQSYMSNHHIFSYYENKKCETDGYSIDEDCVNQVDQNRKATDDYEWFLRGHETSFERILFDIEELQSRVIKQKNQLNKVLGRVSTYSSPPGNNVSHEHQLAGCAESHSSPDSSYGEAAEVGIIESVMDLLAPANNPGNLNQMGVSCMDIADGILIDNTLADEELHSFKVSHEQDKLPEVVEEESTSSSEDEGTSSEILVQESDPESESDDAQRRPVPKPYYIRNKRGRKPKRNENKKRRLD